MCDQTLENLLSRAQIKRRDAAEVRWSHAVNSRSRLTEAVTGTTMTNTSLRVTGVVILEFAIILLIFRYCLNNLKGEFSFPRRF